MLLRHQVVRDERGSNHVIRAILTHDRQKLEDKELTTVESIGAAAALSPAELSMRFAAIYPNDKQTFSREAMDELADAVEWNGK